MHRFIEAVINPDGFSFSVSEEDGSIFAMALGEIPTILECERLATSRGVLVDLNKFEHHGNWDFYSFDTFAFQDNERAIECENNLEIRELLEKHAPNSSVWPGNPEILFWGEVREDNLLVSTGALVKWRTGQVMFSSIATHTDFRGKGYAQKLVQEMASTAAARGIKHLGLGVAAENIAAKNAYERAGLVLVAEFTSYQLKTI